MAKALSVSGLAVFNDSAAFLGRIQFRFSGVATVPTGSRSVVVPVDPGAIDFDTLGLATMQQHRPGVFVEAAVPDQSRSILTIHLNAKVSESTRVAWCLIQNLGFFTSQALRAKAQAAMARASRSIPQP